MIYRDFQGEKLSGLGFGTMRLPKFSADEKDIDQEQVNEMTRLAMEAGVNYYDTAWGYHDGMSEISIGKALAQFPRESFNIATKFPGYSLDNMDKVKEIFPKQLEKTGMEYFDFYLFHNVCDMNVDHYLDPKYGILDYLLKQKADGKIRHLGFSCHGPYDCLKKFLEGYGEHMEFCQLQLNYIDYEFQDCIRKLELLKEYNIPVWVMEPLRGGKLCNLPEEYLGKMENARPGKSQPDWGFRFLQTLPQVTMVLSGMSSIAQMKENLAIWNTDEPLEAGDFDLLLQVGRHMTGKTAVPCTACRYCTSHCPKGLDIPALLAYYNEHYFSGGGFIAPMGLAALPEDKLPSACIGCRSCEQVCPQTIKISEVMKHFTEIL